MHSPQEQSRTLSPSAGSGSIETSKVTWRDKLYSYYSGAGGGAWDQYKKLTRNRQKRYRRVAVISYIILCIPIIAVVLLEWPHPGIFVLGVALGVLLGMVIALLSIPDGRAEWQMVGSQGERLTAQVLAPLRHRGYRIFHDLPDSNENGQRGNVDHVVVSSKGVFLLDSKNWGGRSRIEDDVVCTEMFDDNPDDPPSQDFRVAGKVKNCARRFKKALDKETNVEWVYAVVVFWNPLEAENQAIKGDWIYYVHGNRLATWLEEWPELPYMTAPEIDRVVACIESVRPPYEVSKRKQWLARIFGN